MNYVLALNTLLKEQPNLKKEAQHILSKGAQDILKDSANPTVISDNYEHIYKAVKAIADKEILKA